MKTTKPIHTKKKTGENKEFFSRVSFVDKLLFTKHLSVMLKSGVPLADALDTLSKQTRSSALKKVIDKLLSDVRNGQSLGIALKKHPKTFDLFYISLIDIGEESGTLEGNLDYLVSHLSKTYALRKKIQGALMYPMIVLIALVIVGGGISLFVLPKLVDLFSSFKADLPVTTRILLFIANSMKNYGFFIIGGLIAFGVLIRFLIQLPLIQPIWHKSLLRLPIAGPFIQNAQLASLTRNLGVMLKSGLPIKSALEIQYKITSNLVFKHYIAEILAAIEKGKNIADELNTGRFPYMSPIVIRMIGVGEKTGKLDEILLYLGDFFEDEVDDAAKNLSTVLEPIILLVVGLIVGFVALAIISPIYQITGSIRQQ